MIEFFDDLWATLRFRFKSINEYNYSFLIILLVLLLYSLSGLVLSVEEANPLVSIAKNKESAILITFLFTVTQVVVYSIILTYFLFDKNKHANWKNVLSFLTLTYFVVVPSLFFYYFGELGIFLNSFLMVYSIVIFLLGLKFISQQSTVKILLTYFFAIVCYLLSLIPLIMLFFNLGLIDSVKFQEFIKENYSEYIDKMEQVKSSETNPELSKQAEPNQAIAPQLEQTEKIN